MNMLEAYAPTGLPKAGREKSGSIATFFAQSAGEPRRNTWALSDFELGNCICRAKEERGFMELHIQFHECFILYL